MKIIETKCGKIKGFSEGGISKWLGIPYAEAPIGERRFRRPEPKQPWDGVLDATAYGNRCPGIALPVGVASPIPASEDCLFLNIWTKNDEVSNKPVFVWVHGGGLVGGEGSEGIYEGSNFAREEDVVVVTLNYRLGIIGGLYNLDKFPALKGRYTTNTALLDVMEALRWTKDNIAEFGGDPNNITLAGQSAGGIIVSALLAIPETKCLYQKAAIESVALHSIAKKDDVADAEKVLALLGLTPETADGIFNLSGQEMMDKIKAGPWGDVMYGAKLIQDELLPALPAELLGQHGVDVPVIIGTTASEAAIFFSPDDIGKPLTQCTFSGLCQLTEATDLSRAEAAYAPLQMPGNLIRLATDRGFVMPTLWIIDAIAKNGKIYVYRFDYTSAKATAIGLGAFHIFDVPFLFNNLHDPMAALVHEELDIAGSVARAMQHAWAQFARSGDPGWDAYRPDDRNFYSLNRTCCEMTGYGEGVLEIWK